MGYNEIYVWINELGEIEASSCQENVPQNIKVWSFLVPAFYCEWDEIVVDFGLWREPSKASE